MTTKYEDEPKGYLRPTEMEIFDLTTGIGRGVSLTFIHTLDSERKAVATIPLADATHEWPLRIFLQFNADYPEAIQHTDTLNSYVQRLSEHG